MQTPQQRLVIQVAHLETDGLFYKKTAEQVVALTIDDMPTPNETNEASSQMILDAMARSLLRSIATHNQDIENASDSPEERLRQQARATFFIISSHLSDQSTLLDRMVERGHEIANHGTADETTALLKPEVFTTQFKAAHEHITQRLATSSQPSLRWYRPGRRLYNKAMLSTLQQMPNYVPRFALASMLPVNTFKPARDGAFTAWYASQHFFPGSILVLHGGSLERCQQTARALPVILTDLHQQGYRVVTLSELWDGA